ncbi:hypothetical protein CEXT_282061 [Caerostris extrusa]|uniref:Uncharacterized protein n=1 Tax=Caerostris extrusa TaxID=172846 RepID=A0AAV4MVX4_CAEEX|nr:hypothetical protein CEXT_282061 [Caerostris extrusa]
MIYTVTFEEDPIPTTSEGEKGITVCPRLTRETVFCFIYNFLFHPTPYLRSSPVQESHFRNDIRASGDHLSPSAVIYYTRNEEGVDFTPCGELSQCVHWCISGAIEIFAFREHAPDGLLLALG